MTKTAEKIKIIQDIYALPNSYLANLLGYSATYIRNIRNGKRIPSFSFINNFCSFFEMPVDMLIDDNQQIVIKIDTTISTGKKLEIYRIEHGYTLQSLSKAINVPFTTIASMEKSKTTPSLKVLKAYSHYFNIPLINLLNNNF